MQRECRDIIGKTLSISDKSISSNGMKVGFSLPSFFSFDINNSKSEEVEKNYTPKELIREIFSEKDLSAYFFVYKVRLSEISTKINYHNGESKVLDKILKVFSSDAPRKVEERSILKRNYFENIWVFLHSEFTYGILKDFLYNENTFFSSRKPDIDADDFYLICSPNSIDNCRDVSHSGKKLEEKIISPLAIVRIKQKDIKD